jgi:zinc transporter ZupT
MAFAVVTGEIDWWRVVVWAAFTAVVIVVFGLIGADLAQDRRRDALAGALLGMLFGPLGWLVILMVGRRQP